MKETKKYNNPSAFPVHPNVTTDRDAGMTLRYHFAGLAMQGMIESDKIRELCSLKGNINGNDWQDILAENAFIMADSMLKQREL